MPAFSDTSPHTTAVDARPSADDAPHPERLESLANGLALLREFASGVSSLTVQTAAQRLGITRAAARRLLITLEGDGYLRSQGYDYHVTPKVLDLGFAYYASMSLPRLAHSTLQALGQQVGEACSLGVWDQGHVVVVARHEPARMLRVNVDVGRRLPAAAHSMGRVLLASQPVAAQRAHLKQHPPQAFTRETITDTRQLLQVLADVKAQGWCILCGELAEGFCGVSVPVHGSDGHVLAALSVTMVQGLRTRDDLHAQFVPQLQAHAQQLQALVQGRGQFQVFNF